MTVVMGFAMVVRKSAIDVIGINCVQSVMTTATLLTAVNVMNRLVSIAGVTNCVKIVNPVALNA